MDLRFRKDTVIGERYCNRKCPKIMENHEIWVHAWQRLRVPGHSNYLYGTLEAQYNTYEHIYTYMFYHRSVFPVSINSSSKSDPRSAEQVP